MGRKKKPGTPEWKRRYLAKNPTIAMVGTPARRHALDEIRGNKSYGQAFDEFMSKMLNPHIELMNKLDKARARIRELEEENEEFSIGFPCEVCGEMAYLTRSAPPGMLKYIEKILKEMYHWRHDDCSAEN